MDIPALPFWKSSVSFSNPLFSDTSGSIGVLLKRKRLSLHLFQKDVAKILKVNEATITNWENDNSQPMVHCYPAIIHFLGYNPFEVEMNRFGDTVKNYRLKHGLSHKKLGKKFGVDASTVGAWESGKSEPHLKTKEQVERQLLN